MWWYVDAEYFMNCGNHKLMVAGMIWTRKQGFKITQPPIESTLSGVAKIENGK